VCGVLQNGMDLGETVPSVCSERSLTVTACGSEVSDLRAWEVLHTQEEGIRLALSLLAVTAADKVCVVNSGASLYCGICILAMCCVVL
jgi:hypothetical protein